MPKKQQKKKVASAKRTPDAEAANPRRRVTRGSSANALAQRKTPSVRATGIALSFQSPDGHDAACNNEDEKNEDDEANVANVLLAGKRHSSREKKDDNRRTRQIAQPQQEGGGGGNNNSDDSEEGEENDSDDDTCDGFKEAQLLRHSSKAARTKDRQLKNSTSSATTSSPRLNPPEDDNSENDTGDRKRKRESKRIAQQKERKASDTNKPIVTATEVDYKIHEWFIFHKSKPLKGILLLKKVFYIVFVEGPNNDGRGIAKLGYVYADGTDGNRPANMEHCFGKRLKNMLELSPNGKVHVKCIDLEGASLEATTTIEELAKFTFYAQTRALPDGVCQSIYSGAGECYIDVTMNACDILATRMLQFARTGVVHYKDGNREKSITGTSYKQKPLYRHYLLKTSRKYHSRTNGCVWQAPLYINDVNNWLAEWEAYSLYHEATCPCLKHIPGIENLGETCYLSAALQMLFCIPDFQNELHHFCINSDETPLTDALLSVSDVIGNQVVDPSEVKEVLNEITRGSMETGQQDAHECLVTLLTQLREEWNGSDDYSVLVVEVRRQCKRCGLKSRVYETDHDLRLDLGEDEEDDSLSIEQCIKDYFNVQEVDCACSCGCNVFTEERNIIAR